MKRTQTLTAGTALLALSITPAVFADPNLPPPPLSDYIAYKAPKPPVCERIRSSFSGLKNFYVTGKAGISSVNITSIDNVGPGINLPAPSVTKFNDTVKQAGVGIGYQFRKSGIFSRVELEYMKRGTIGYNPNPPLNFTVPLPPIVTLNSSIDNQTLFLKVYYDFDFDTPFIPYLQVGAGLSRTEVTSNGSFTPDITIPAVTSSQEDTKNSFAGDAGLGLRIRLMTHLYADLGYEFDYLGSGLSWTVQTFDPNFPVILKSGPVYSNNFIAGLSLQI